MSNWLTSFAEEERKSNAVKKLEEMKEVEE